MVVAPDEIRACCHQLEQSCSASSPAGNTWTPDRQVCSFTLMSMCCLYTHTKVFGRSQRKCGINVGNLSEFCRACLLERKTSFLIKSNHPTITAVMCLAALCDTDEHGVLLMAFHMKPDRSFPMLLRVVLGCMSATSNDSHGC